jgi:hypothetical protein
MIKRTPIEVLLEAIRQGVTLGFEPPNTLTYEPISKCSPAFKETLRSFKPQLLALFALPFVMINSKAVGALLFFCEDEETKAALIRAGADTTSIYTKAELRILAEQNRVEPLSLDELAKVHEIKKTFKATITGHRIKPIDF